jgi:hypothetical protein
MAAMPIDRPPMKMAVAVLNLPRLDASGLFEGQHGAGGNARGTGRRESHGHQDGRDEGYKKA